MPIVEKRKYALNWMARQKEPDFHLKCILFSKMRKNGSSFSTEIAPKPHCAFNVWHSLTCNLQNGMKSLLKSYFFIHLWFNYELFVFLLVHFYVNGVHATDLHITMRCPLIQYAHGRQKVHKRMLVI